jgi:hypothetical protein
MSMDERDPDLGAAVRQLQTPPPGPDFFPRLVERLREEAERMESERQRRRWRMTSLVGLAATVLVVVMVASWVGLPGTGPGSRGVLGPRTAAAVTVEELKMIVATSVAKARTVQGEITVNLPNESLQERRWSFAITGSGDFRLTALDRREDVSYSARTGAYRTYSATEGGRVLAVETAGLATGPPDPAAEVSVLSRSLGSAVRAFLAARTSAPVTEATYEGREAWILNTTLSQPEPPNVDELEVIVDRETGFPLRIRTATGPRGFNVRDVRISKLVVDAPVPAEHFLLEFPPGTPPVVPIDKGFRRVGRTEVAAADRKSVV